MIDVGLESISSLQQSFNTKYGIRKFTNLPDPKVTPITGAVLPRRPLMHFIPDLETDLGIGPRDTALMLLTDDNDIDELELYVYHETKPVRTEGLIGTRKDEKKLIQEYHKKFTQFSRVFQLETALKSTLPVIVNYGLIEHCYPQQIRDPLRPWKRGIDLLQTQWATINRLMTMTDRQQYVFYKVPKTLPDVERVKEVVKKQSVTTLKTFNERRDFYVFDLLSWFGGDFVETPSKYESPIDLIKPQYADRVTLVFLEDDDFTSVQLDELLEWKEKEKNPRARLSKLYQVFNRLVELRTPVVVTEDVIEGDIATAEKTDDASIFMSIEEAQKQVDVKPTDYTKGVMRLVDDLAEGGQLSGREYKHLAKQAEKYKTFENPFAKLPSAQGTDAAKDSFEGLLKRSVDDVFGQVMEKTYPQMATVKNESYLKDRVTGFDQLYIEKMFHKDIAATVMSLQKVGLPITKFEVTEVKDAVNHFQRFSVQTTPVNGQQSTFKFDIPVVDKEGIFVNNGVKCRFNKQRADIPIVKTAPDECVLTSAMGKMFIRRTPRVAYNLDEWIHRNIMAGSVKTEENDTITVTGLRVKATFSNKWDLPYGYTVFARKFTQFTTQGITWNWDYDKREEWLGKPIADYEVDGRVVCGKKNGGVVVVDRSNLYHLLEGNKETFLGDLSETFGFSGKKKPAPFAETKIFGKSITVGMMLAYILGIEKLFAKLNIKYEVIDRTVRRQAQANEIVIVFNDVKVFLKDVSPTNELIINGLNYYETPLKETDFNDLNQRSGYTTVLAFRGLGVHHQRECELMDLMWVDPITELLLTQMKEPTTFVPLVVRACMLIATDKHSDESDPLNTVNKGYSRMVEMVYRELMTGVRDYRNESARKRNTMSINPNAVKLAIIQDEAVALIEESNPIHNMKEKERVTFNGSGGRSAQTLMGRNRLFHEHDLGFAGEGTTDNGKTGTIFYTSADPNYTSLYGTIRKVDEKKDGDAPYITSTSLVLPFATYDDGKRTVFAQIQGSSWANSVGMTPYPVRTSYDACIAHRVGKLFAFPAEEEGVIKRITKTTVIVTYKSGKEDSCKIGKLFGRAAGKVIPHELICDLAEGAKFKKGDILVFNRFYFARDWLNPTQVTLLLGVPTIVAFRENMNTYEDASTISLEASKKFASYTSKCRDILVTYTDEIQELVAVGDHVDYDDKLCTIIPGEAVVPDEEIVGAAGLQQLADATPKAKYSGEVEHIEVLYCGDIANASTGLAKLIRKDNVRRMQLSKETNGEEAASGEIKEPTFIANNYIAKNTALIRVYITHLKPMRAGDKAVFCNSIKTVPSAVFHGTYTTFKGLPVDATYSYAGIMNRIVESPKYMGVLAMILRQIGLNAAALYRGKNLK